MNVLSLFDGISAGQLALERAGIPVTNYYAAEIDKYATAITQANFPDTIQLGDVTKYFDWNLPDIDLIIFGSPCQGFSFAGKQLNFDDPRSALFFTAADILDCYKPKHFLMENVKMKQEYRDVISERLGVEPIEINSALVSAQNRRRLYWGSFPITQPEDKGILLKNVILDDALFCVSYNRNDGITKLKDKAFTINSSDYRGLNRNQNQTACVTKDCFSVCMHNLYGGFKEKNHRTFIEKSPTIRTAAGGGHIPSLLLSEKALDYMDRRVKGGRNHWDFKHHSDINNPKSAAVVANFFKGVPYNVLKDNNCIRHFHPVECERLQTFPDGYCDNGLFDGELKPISKTQKYKALGNSWTVDVIAHIFGGL